MKKMEANDIIGLLLAAYEDKIQQEVLEETRDSLNALMSADADARRTECGTDIRRMNKLKISLKKFERQYARINSRFGKCTAIDDYIAEIEAEIKTLSLKKNHGMSF